MNSQGEKRAKPTELQRLEKMIQKQGGDAYPPDHAEPSQLNTNTEEGKRHHSVAQKETPIVVGKYDPCNV